MKVFMMQQHWAEGGEASSPGSTPGSVASQPREGGQGVLLRRRDAAGNVSAQPRHNWGTPVRLVKGVPRDTYRREVLKHTYRTCMSVLTVVETNTLGFTDF